MVMTESSVSYDSSLTTEEATSSMLFLGEDRHMLFLPMTPRVDGSWDLHRERMAVGIPYPIPTDGNTLVAVKEEDESITLYELGQDA